MFDYLDPVPFIILACSLSAFILGYTIKIRKKIKVKPSKAIAYEVGIAGLLAAVQKWAVAYSGSHIMKVVSTTLLTICNVILFGTVIYAIVKIFQTKGKYEERKKGLIVVGILLLICLILLIILIIFT